MQTRKPSHKMSATEDLKSAPPAANNVALIVGVTGLVGKELAKMLTRRPGWKVYGLARNPAPELPSSCHFRFISCDLLDRSDAEKKLSSLRDVTHVFWLSWASQYDLDTYQCREQNVAMMSNALDAILPRAVALRHISLQTGTNHYFSSVGPFDGLNRVHDETSPRVGGGHNFYYALEDLLAERLAGRTAGWSVHRPGLILGSSTRTVFNFVGGICVYGSVCKYLNLPFLFAGSRACWEETYMDTSDARLVAAQHAWASMDGQVASSKGEPFNAVNGPGLTWKEAWPALAAKFGVEVPEPGFSPHFTLSAAMCDKGDAWEEIVEREGLRRTKMGDLANWWFLDSLFRCPVKMLVSQKKANRFGFKESFEPVESILYWVDRMREEKLIP